MTVGTVSATYGKLTRTCVSSIGHGSTAPDGASGSSETTGGASGGAEATGGASGCWCWTTGRASGVSGLRAGGLGPLVEQPTARSAKRKRGIPPLIASPAPQTNPGAYV